jgi:hypothetical protein
MATLSAFSFYASHRSLPVQLVNVWQASGKYFVKSIHRLYQIRVKEQLAE